ncbi:MAG: glutamine--fructose-6-phosphate transaminase (isomerizing) [Alphaproteobacteria bacterium]|nr:glutamine--fructose-6-phosphate transaminase (isomerizing) [Alphaproteobacteria bacterium]
MCGIVSAISLENSFLINDLLNSLEKLEYRGYDSSGIAYIEKESINCVKSVGRIDNLKNKLGKTNINTTIGIGHTRWATHGKVTEQNAHPHIAGSVAIVHNGIIENYQEIKSELIGKGAYFKSDTDSEVIAHLIDNSINNGHSFEEAFKIAITKLKGTFAIAAISEKFQNTLIAAKKGSPMAIGMTSDNSKFFVASDAVALASISDRIAYLEDNDILIAKNNGTIEFQIINSDERQVHRKFQTNIISKNSIDKNGFENFMLKEIYEELETALATFNNFQPLINLSEYTGISIIACGTSYYAGMLAKYWIEQNLKIHVDVEIASEFRYKEQIFSDRHLCIFISQSGETIDTLSALKKTKAQNISTLAIVNVENSSIAREADHIIKTFAGPEIGVASTKAFIAQSLTLLLLSISKDKIDINAIKECISFVLHNNILFKNVAEKIQNSRALFYIGRGENYPIALEGALKIKELTYVSAEAYPSGEIKHGPIAIIDENVSTIVIAPNDNLFEKTISNAQEILARNGRLIILTTEDAKTLLSQFENNSQIDIIYLPKINKSFIQFALATSVHFLAYHSAKIKKLDVDKPRNLAKSVTVE